MSVASEIHVCGCPSCQDGELPLHHEINVFVSRPARYLATVRTRAKVDSNYPTIRVKKTFSARD